MASVQTTSASAARPGHASIVLDAHGRPQLRAFRCRQCSAVLPEQTMACRACGARDGTEPFTPSERGRLYAWSVVHRSYPRVAVPFVSAIVDLDDGLTLKGTLRSADQDALRSGMPVRLVFDDAGGATDKEGKAFIGFHFVPENGQ